MRHLALYALLIVALPLTVAIVQYRATYRDTGAPAQYLEIDEPPRVDPGDVVPLESGSIPVLCYHYLRPDPGAEDVARAAGTVLLNLPLIRSRDYWATSTHSFERQMSWLRENGYTALTVNEMAAALRGELDVPQRSVCITFDDGDRSVLEYGLPILRRHGLRATLFVVTGRVGQRWQEVDSLDWTELRQLQESGVFEVHSHTHAMHYKVKGDRGQMIPTFLYRGRDAGGRERVLADLTASRDALRHHLGVDSRFLAWPYGFASAGLDSLAAEAGFHGSFSLHQGGNQFAAEAWHMRRYLVTARTGMRSFRRMVEPTY